MRRFLFKTGVAFGIVVAIHGVTVWLFANGKLDGFYKRFTSPPAHSLILGNSRAAQAIVPNMLDSILQKTKIEGPFFNFSFSLSTSPFGSYYLKSVFRKLDPGTRNGLFIIAVDPWSISRESKLSESDTASFFERTRLPSNMLSVNSDPNFEYLLRNYNSGWGDMIIANTVRTNQAELHDDGWLEVTVPMNPKRHQERIADKIRIYRNENFVSKTFSPWRLNALTRTIEKLKQHGSVILVRIPIDQGLAQIEQEFMPQFDSLMQKTASLTQVTYFNFHSENRRYLTTDGNHLYKSSARIFTKVLGQRVFEDLQRR